MMTKNLFYKLGAGIYSWRYHLVVLWVVIVLACLFVLISHHSPFKSTGFNDKWATSTKAQQDIDIKSGSSSVNQLLVMYHSNTLLANSKAFKQEIQQSLAGLKKFPIKNDIIYPKDNPHQISKNNHSAYAVIRFKRVEPLSAFDVARIKEIITCPQNMTLELGGQAIFVEDVNKQTQDDLYRADMIAAPIAVITLLLVFGSLTAAMLPVMLGGGCAVIILACLYLLGQVITLSVYTLNIALLLGLCLSLDYCLFIINRFREELQHNQSMQESIAISLETAGKAVFFSGLAVLISLSALFIFPVTILFSMAVGGSIAVLMAVFTAVIILPAILGMLKHHINRLSVSGLFWQKPSNNSLWRWLAEQVVARPLTYFFAVLALLLALGLPFLSAKFGVSDYRITPEQSKSRQFFDTYAKQFDIKELTPILLLIETPHGFILSQHNLAHLYTLVHQLASNKAVADIRGIISSDSPLTKKQYYALYSTPAKLLGGSIKALLAATTGHSFTVLTVNSQFASNSFETADLVNTLRHTTMPAGMTMQVTGTPVTNLDVVNRILQRLPWALLWIAVATYLILLVLLRSLFLPLKAIIMNCLSLCACYGALVLVFQDGYLASYLNFEAQGSLDISLLVIIFCALFGFSMDYEVFLLSRIKEAYQQNGFDNKQSIVTGIEKSSRIITSAAMIVIVICGSFLVADVLMVKAFGIGIAVAIFVDAFLIRTLLVPSTMVLLEQWNWYLPSWLYRVLVRG